MNARQATIPLMLLAAASTGLAACGSSGSKTRNLSVDQVAAALRHNHIDAVLARISSRGPATGAGALSVDVTYWRKYHAVGFVVERRPLESRGVPLAPILRADIYESPKYTHREYPRSAPSVPLHDGRSLRIIGRVFLVSNVVLYAPTQRVAAVAKAVAELRREAAP